MLEDNDLKKVLKTKVFVVEKRIPQRIFFDVKKCLRYIICHKLVIKSITIEKMLNHWTLDPVDSGEDKGGVIT